MVSKKKKKKTSIMLILFFLFFWIAKTVRYKQIAVHLNLRLLVYRINEMSERLAFFSSLPVDVLLLLHMHILRAFGFWASTFDVCSFVTVVWCGFFFFISFDGHQLWPAFYRNFYYRFPFIFSRSPVIDWENIIVAMKKSSRLISNGLFSRQLNVSKCLLNVLIADEQINKIDFFVYVRDDRFQSRLKSIRMKSHKLGNVEFYFLLRIVNKLLHLAVSIVCKHTHTIFSLFIGCCWLWRKRKENIEIISIYLLNSIALNCRLILCTCSAIEFHLSRFSTDEQTG